MKVKKIASAPFHLGNKLSGSKSPARYGIFQGDKQVGILFSNGSIWTAYNMKLRPDFLDFSCGSLSEIKSRLEAIE
jgi:hypothetical protein